MITPERSSGFAGTVLLTLAVFGIIMIAGAAAGRYLGRSDPAAIPAAQPAQAPPTGAQPEGGAPGPQP